MSVTTTMKSKRRSPLFSPRRVWMFAPALLLSGGAGAVASLGRIPENQVAPGVQVASLALGGKTLQEARTALQQFAAKQGETRIVLRFPESYGITRTWTPPAAKLGLGIDASETLNEVGKAGRAGGIGQALRLITGTKPVPVAPRPTVDEAKVRAYLKQQVAKDVNRAPQNARLSLFKKGGFGVNKEKLGFALDLDASVQAITQAWTDYHTPKSFTEPPKPQPAPEQTPPANEGAPNAQPPAEPGNVEPGKTETPTVEVEMLGKVTQPKVTAEALKEIDGNLGSYSTYYGGTGANRGNNIALATGKINGTLLAPGEIFSYNRIVGPRSARYGFKEAPVIIRGELVPGIGGGICQVSSTLYNAALLADLKITRRSHHAFPVHYLPAGRDATVVDGSIDFQFQNNTPAPIYIAASSSGGRLSFRILGKTTPGKTVRIELANHSIIPNGAETIRDPSLPAGKRRIKDSGHRGHRVTVYRVVKEEGKEPRRELIARDYYRPFPAVVIVGTKQVAPPPTVPANPGVPPANSAPANPPSGVAPAPEQ